MGSITSPLPIKFFCGLIYREGFDLPALKQELTRCWGPVDMDSAALPFTYTDYYDEEMGAPLFRTFWSFDALINRELLVERKIESNNIEERFSRNGKRAVNIDPGYLTLGQLVLASTKDHEQRIYLGRGIFAEVTLRYSKNRYHAYPWTYRDYASPEYETVFLEMRKKLYTQLRKASSRAD